MGVFAQHLRFCPALAAMGDIIGRPKGFAKIFGERWKACLCGLCHANGGQRAFLMPKALKAGNSSV
jgi:hypothetical protein